MWSNYFLIFLCIFLAVLMVIFIKLLTSIQGGLGTITHFFNR